MFKENRKRFTSRGKFRPQHLVLISEETPKFFNNGNLFSFAILEP